MEFELPCNLDDMSIDPEDYRRFADWIRTQKAYPISTRNRVYLTQYAEWKCASMRERLHGNINSVQLLERGMERIFSLLSPKWRW